MRPVSVVEQLRKDDKSPALLVKCQCNHSNYVGLDTKQTVCNGCGKELDWGLRK